MLFVYRMSKIDINQDHLSYSWLIITVCILSFLASSLIVTCIQILNNGIGANFLSLLVALNSFGWQIFFFVFWKNIERKYFGMEIRFEKPQDAHLTLNTFRLWHIKRDKKFIFLYCRSWINVAYMQNDETYIRHLITKHSP